MQSEKRPITPSLGTRCERFLILSSLVGLDGLEPTTSVLSGLRSNRLSYRPTGPTIIPIRSPGAIQRFEIAPGHSQGPCRRPCRRQSTVRVRIRRFVGFSGLWSRSTPSVDDDPGKVLMRRLAADAYPLCRGGTVCRDEPGERDGQKLDDGNWMMATGPSEAIPEPGDESSLSAIWGAAAAGFDLEALWSGASIQTCRSGASMQIPRFRQTGRAWGFAGIGNGVETR